MHASLLRGPPAQALVRSRCCGSTLLQTAVRALHQKSRLTQTFVPFKSNTLEPTEAGTWAKMHHLFMYQREAFMEHYHKRSNIETAYSMIKGKFGSALRSKSDVGQINEALAKVLCHNICVLVQAMHELGIEPAFVQKSVLYKNALLSLFFV